MNDKCRSSNENVRRVDPDPVSIFLAVLGAVGSIASIYAVADVEHSRRVAKRNSKARYRTRHAALALEAAIEQLRDLTDRVATMVRTQDMRDSINSTSSDDSPRFRLGAVPLYLDTYELRAYTDLHNGVLDQIKNVNESTVALINELYLSFEQWDDSPLKELIGLREQTNDLIFSHPRKSESYPRFSEVMKRTHHLCTDTMRVLRDLQSWLVDGEGHG